MAQNRPNPFTRATEIRYGLPKDSDVNITVYNLSGQKVATIVDEGKKAGYHTARWDGRDKSGKKVASGIYFIRLEAGDYRSSKKLILVK